MENSIELVIEENISEDEEEKVKRKVFDYMKKSKKKILTINTELNNNTFNYHPNISNPINDNSDLSDSDSVNETYKGSINSDNDVIYVEDLNHTYEKNYLSKIKLSRSRK